MHYASQPSQQAGNPTGTAESERGGLGENGGNKFPHIYIPILIFHFTDTFLYIIYEISLVRSSVGINHFSNSFPSTIIPVPDIDIAILVHYFSNTMSDIIFHSSIINISV